MHPLIHELTAVVLPVDIHKQGTELPQLGGRNRHPADPADALPFPADTALQDQLFLTLHAVFLQPVRGRRAVKHRGDKRLVCPAAHQFPADTAAENRADGVDDDGFTCAGLTGEDVQAGRERNIRPLDHRYIFYMQLLQHVQTPSEKSSNTIYRTTLISW